MLSLLFVAVFVGFKNAKKWLNVQTFNGSFGVQFKDCVSHPQAIFSWKDIHFDTFQAVLES